jgi:hypothetical protein
VSASEPGGGDGVPRARDDISGDLLSRDEFDTPAEVDAVFRTQRRIAVGYGLVFIGGVLVIPTLTLVTDWWSSGRLGGWWTTSFVAAGAGLYLFFFLLGIGAASLSTGVENRMLGNLEDPSEDELDDLK